MNANEIAALAQATQDGSLAFPEVVSRLIARGVESYQVDLAARAFTFYNTAGATVSAPLTFEGLPAIAEALDPAALQAAIRDSQEHGQTFRTFCVRGMQAGVLGYFAFLRGQRVTYLGRQGDSHTEWFPGAKPGER